MGDSSATRMIPNKLHTILMICLFVIAICAWCLSGLLYLCSCKQHISYPITVPILYFGFLEMNGNHLCRQRVLNG